MPDPIQPDEAPMTSSPQEERLEDCIALCLSGGGYRAMLFHVGVIWWRPSACQTGRAR
jgi:hypothetical protein